MSEMPTGMLMATGTVSGGPIAYGDLELYEDSQRYEVGSVVTFHNRGEAVQSYEVESAERTSSGWRYKVIAVTDAAD